ncbi:MAG TPA: RNA 2',3'-cyclic phosphodiesterase [Sedimenticola sp.]|nr:RNA 2',3'-cyclic phosphodiesterase [Sedimenticola sp.]
MPEQRLFFALWPAPDLVPEIIRIKQGLPPHGGRPPHPDDLHMTLVFLGAAGPERLPCVERAADAVEAGPFSLELDRIGYWLRPRILWLGSSETPGPLAGLVGQLQAGLADCGFRPERRPFKPHVTLARKARPVPPAALESPLQWPVREFVLAGSGLADDPPRYRVLRRWALDESP